EDLATGDGEPPLAAQVSYDRVGRIALGGDVKRHAAPAGKTLRIEGIVEQCAHRDGIEGKDVVKLRHRSAKVDDQARLARTAIERDGIQSDIQQAIAQRRNEMALVEVQAA